MLRTLRARVATHSTGLRRAELVVRRACSPEVALSHVSSSPREGCAEEVRPGGMGRGTLRFMERDRMTSRLCSRHSPTWGRRCGTGSSRKGTDSRRIQGRKAKNKNHWVGHRRKTIWHSVSHTSVIKFTGQTPKWVLCLQ